MSMKFSIAMFFFLVQNFFSDNTRVRIFFPPEFNIRLYDKNSESDYFFSSTKIRIFFQYIGNQNIFLEKNIALEKMLL